MKVFGGDHMVFRGGRREGGFNRCEKSLEGGLKRIHRQSGGGEGGRRITVTQQNFMGDLGYIRARAEYEVREIICWLHCRVLVSKKEEKWDQYQYLGNCPPTPPLTQQQSIDNKLGLMLG